MNLVLIVIAVLALASFVVAFFAARTWHWSQVVVVVFIVFATVGYFLLAAEALRINAVLRSRVNKLESDLAKVDSKINALQKGTTDGSLIGQLRNETWPNDAPAPIAEDAESIPSRVELNHKLHLATRARGPVWRKVALAGFDAPTNAVRINIESPVPPGLAADTVVFLFEAGEPELPEANGAPRGPQYLGEFRVTKVDGQVATLEPVLPLDDFERQRLSGSRVPWVMHEVMPNDRYEIFAGLSEEELKKQIPPQSVNEYLRHGKPANADDDDLRKAGFDETDKRLPPDQMSSAAKILYQRRLRDYALEFDQLAKQRAVLATDLAGVKADIERLKVAQASAEELKAFREEEKEKLNKDFAHIGKEYDAIATHLKQVQQQLARAEALLAETLRRNREMAQALAARQSSNVEPGGNRPSATADPRGPLALDAAR